MKSILVTSLVLLSLGCYADGPTISGNTEVFAGDIESYTVTWEQWDNTYEGYSNITWNITGGTVINSDKHSVTIQWNTLEEFMDGIGNIEVSEDLGSQYGNLSITITNETLGPNDFCSGILGPAKVFVNFGSGINPGAPLPPGITTYQYNTNCALNVGQYTIRSNSNLCRSAWHNILQDHTGNPNGYFLMVNASNSRGEIYKSVVSGLTSSFRYEFSAWVGNLFNNTSGQDPNIKFEIYNFLSGTLLASSGDIVIGPTVPTFQWQKVGFMFDIPPGVASVQVVVVNARRRTNDFGNDMVIDDISFAPCYPGIVASFSNTTTVDIAHICQNGTVNLYSSWPLTIPFVNPAYRWQRSADNGVSWSNISGATSLNHVQTESLPGIFKYRMYSYETSTPTLNLVSNTLTYYVQTIVVDAHTTKFYACAGSPVSGGLESSIHYLYFDPAELTTLNFNYLWSPGTYINNPNVMSAFIVVPALTTPPGGGPPAPPTTLNYNLTVTNTKYGCSASNTQTVLIHNPRNVGVASAFHPAGPAPNNVIVPVNIEDYPPGSEFSIYNRWGNRVFHSFGPTVQDYTWNGRYQGVLLPEDYYVWTIKLTACPGNIVSASNGPGVPYGEIALLR